VHWGCGAVLTLVSHSSRGLVLPFTSPDPATSPSPSRGLRYTLTAHHGHRHHSHKTTSRDSDVTVIEPHSFIPFPVKPPTRPRSTVWRAQDTNHPYDSRLPFFEKYRNKYPEKVGPEIDGNRVATDKIKVQEDGETRLTTYLHR